MYLKTFNPRDIRGASHRNVNVESVVTNKLHRNGWTTAEPVPVEYLVN